MHEARCLQWWRVHLLDGMYEELVVPLTQGILCHLHDTVLCCDVFDCSGSMGWRTVHRGARLGCGRKLIRNSVLHGTLGIGCIDLQGFMLSEAFLVLSYSLCHETQLLVRPNQLSAECVPRSPSWWSRGLSSGVQPLSFLTSALLLSVS